MPYSSTRDLPASVRDHLPEHAQEIFKAAFNSAYAEYRHDEERAFRVAWAVVKKHYHKSGLEWIENEARE